MKRSLHTVIGSLALLVLLGACGRNPEEGAGARVGGGPADVNLVISVQDFGGAALRTRADYEPLSVDELHYAEEKRLDDVGLFVFDATEAFSGDPLAFNPAAARLIASRLDHADGAGDRMRVDFHLDNAYGSLAVLVLANYGSAVYTASGVPAAGSTLKDVVDYFSGDAAAMAFDPTKGYGKKCGIPMFGLQVFGDLSGLAASATDAQKDGRRLKYYSGMSTPLTKHGFRTAAELEHYAGNLSGVTGYGAVRDEDCLPLRYALSRLHISYRIDSSLPIEYQKEVTLLSGRVTTWRNKIRILPKNFLTATGGELHPFSDVDDLGDVVNSAAEGYTGPYVEFVRHETENTLAAYVPEFRITRAGIRKPDDQPLEKEPVLTQVKVRNHRDDEIEFSSLSRYPWLYLRLLTDKTDPDAAVHPGGANFNLVRHYSYEWVATGIQ